MGHSGETRQIPVHPCLLGLPHRALRDTGDRDGSLSPTYFTPLLSAVGTEVMPKAWSSPLSSLPGGIRDHPLPLFLWIWPRAGTPVALLPTATTPGVSGHPPSIRPCSWLGVTDGCTWPGRATCVPRAPCVPRAGQGTALLRTAPPEPARGGCPAPNPICSWGKQGTGKDRGMDGH